MKRINAALAVAVTVLVSACSSGSYGTVGPADTSSGNGSPPPPLKTSSTALFQPLSGILPYPTDLYFAGSTDGTINIQPPNAAMPNQAAINALDGFSTTAVIRENFGGALDPASFTATSVIVIPVVTDNKTKATIGVIGTGAPLTPGADYSVGLGKEAGVGAQVLEITPLHPLLPSTCLSKGAFLGVNCTTGTGYLVLLTTGITDAAGHPAVADTDYANIKAALAGGPTCPSITDPSMNGICQLTGAQLQIAQHYVDPAKVVLSFSFTTQSTTDTLGLISETTGPQTLAVHPTGLSTAALGLAGHADIWVGTLTIPYYLSKSAPLTESWHAPPFPLDPTSTFVTRYNPLPAPTLPALQIPVLVTVPNTNSAPPGGWPVLIFQHGITRNREDAFAVADSFGDSGFVVVAIDLPLHGITDPTNPLYASSANVLGLYAGLGLPATGSIERTFDLATEAAACAPPAPMCSPAPPPIDPSGSHFINLTSLLTSRDNLRQGVADLIALTRTLPTLTLGSAGINPGAIHYLGHSLGAIEGGTFLSVVNLPGPEVVTGTLAMPGGGIANLLRESATFGPVINAGLAQQGLLQGTTLYEQFFRDAQTAVDSGDPVNFIALATSSLPIHLIQVVGSASPPADCTATPTPAGCPDQVVPNSSTARLIKASMYGASAATALTQIHRPGAPGPVFAPPGGFRAYVNFVLGTHGSVIDPKANPFVTQEMQLEAITFTGQPVPAASFPPTPSGTVILIGNPTVIQP